MEPKYDGITGKMDDDPAIKAFFLWFFSELEVLDPFDEGALRGRRL